MLRDREKLFGLEKVNESPNKLRRYKEETKHVFLNVYLIQQSHTNIRASLSNTTWTLHTRILTLLPTENQSLLNLNPST